ncbi:MAG: hypothetical protein GY799_07980 [Desulfobulbaceae bacterium]|nr:hypothetical protein [Desulfobulbaceae bacterium]
MKTLKFCFVISQAFILLLTISCSNSEDSNEKGVIKETQDKIAQDAINNIKDPLDQAKTARKLANEHTRQIEKAQQ